jgi:hypothetical protein
MTDDKNKDWKEDAADNHEEIDDVDCEDDEEKMMRYMMLRLVSRDDYNKSYKEKRCPIN